MYIFSLSKKVSIYVDSWGPIRSLTGTDEKACMILSKGITIYTPLDRKHYRPKLYLHLR